MSFKMTRLVWKHYPAGGAELLMALAYADHAHDDGTCIRPSVATIALVTRQSERSVSRILAKMRESKWLLMVKRGNGRGFTTEYRINPLWITNPDNLAGRAENDPERVTSEVENPDKRGIKRVTALSSQPLGTFKEPVSANGNGEVSGAFFFSSGLNWPSVFDKSDLALANKILSPFPWAQRQALLSEIADIAQRSGVRRPLGLLKTLVAGQRPAGGDRDEPISDSQVETSADTTIGPVEQKIGLVAPAPSDAVKKATLARLAALRASISEESLSKRSDGRRHAENRIERHAQSS